MSVHWVVVAEGTRARVFESVRSGARLQEVHTLVHPETRLHQGDMRTGGKGEVIESTSPASRQSAPEMSATEGHAEDFAKEISNFLRQQRMANAYGGFTIVAEPQFLGRLRDNLDRTTAGLIEREIDKNWTQHNREQIQRLLKQARWA